MTASAVTTPCNQRDCAFTCVYCDYPFLEGKNRMRDHREIVDEMESLIVAHDFRHFFLYGQRIQFSGPFFRERYRAGALPIYSHKDFQARVAALGAAWANGAVE